MVAKKRIGALAWAFIVMKKILVADRISPIGVAFLREQDGFEVVEAYGSSPEQVLELAKDVHAIIVRSETKVTAEVIAAAPKLVAVGRAGVGVDNIDVEVATERGIIVMNTPSGNTIATAELTFTHMLCGARPIVQAAASMKEGKWDRKSFSGSELRGKNLGVIGMGRIGAEVAKRAQAFAMNVLAYDPYLTEARAKTLGVEMTNLDTLLAQADYITVHMPLTETTQYMLDEKAFEKMKKGVRVFNCARGGIIKETALIEALNSGKVAAAGLDVYEDEPPAKDCPLRTIPNVVLTPHLGASTKEAQESVGIEVSEIIAQVLKDGVINNAVNMPSVDRATLQALRPYLTLGERMGCVLQQIAAGLKVEKLRVCYFGKVADLSAGPLSRAIQRGYILNISGKHVTDVNAPLILKQLGIEVEIVKTNINSDYAELIQLEAIDKAGKAVEIQGTLVGKSQSPRLVHVDGHDLEVSLNGKILFIKNEDTPGTIGQFGTILGNAGVNIANMSLSRVKQDQLALTAFELDSVPASCAMDELKALKVVKDIRLVSVTC